MTWKPDAESELAELWLKASDRGEVARASNEIDRMLKKDPLDIGESREDEYRVLIEPPLGVTFEVLADDRIVCVIAIWRV